MPVNYRVDDELHPALKELAKRVGRSATNYLNSQVIGPHVEKELGGEKLPVKPTERIKRPRKRIR